MSPNLTPTLPLTFRLNLTLNPTPETALPISRCIVEEVARPRSKPQDQGPIVQRKVDLQPPIEHQPSASDPEPSADRQTGPQVSRLHNHNLILA